MEMVSDISVDSVRALGKIWAKLEMAREHVQNETKLFSHFVSDVYVYPKGLSRLICAVSKMENNITMVQYSTQKALIWKKKSMNGFPHLLGNIEFPGPAGTLYMHFLPPSLPSFLSSFLLWEDRQVRVKVHIKWTSPYNSIFKWPAGIMTSYTNKSNTSWMFSFSPFYLTLIKFQKNPHSILAVLKVCVIHLSISQFSISQE